MSRHAWAICVLLAVHSTAVHAQSDEDKLVRDYARTLAKDRDAKDRADAARGLGGRKQPEAVAALAKALSDPDASVRETAASALWKTGKDAAAAKPELRKALGDPEAAVVARAAGRSPRWASPEHGADVRGRQVRPADPAKLDAKNFAGLTALRMGIVSGNPGLEELIAAGARLDPATARAYAEAYKKNPKALALIKKASAQ